jgi:hypothetical protein
MHKGGERSVSSIYTTSAEEQRLIPLGETLEILTSLLLQILNAVPHSRFLLSVPEILIRSRFNNTLFLVFSWANILQSLLDVKAKVVFLVEMLSPSGDELPLRIFCFSHNPDQSLSMDKGSKKPVAADVARAASQIVAGMSSSSRRS